MAEYPIARIFTDSRIQQVHGGTSEIMKAPRAGIRNRGARARRQGIAIPGDQ
ncbi:hypothetical protein [Nocardia australiensis]|uniref:hypothetical protein n=1 Tax=Nocardia australiensis TaxID=2887191 RepID=UPI0035570B97